MGSRDSPHDLIQWDEGTRGNQGTPRFLYMYVKSPQYVNGIGPADIKWWPRPAHLIMYRTKMFACVIDYKQWPHKQIHQQEFPATEIEQAKAWCEVVWRMGK